MDNRIDMSLDEIIKQDRITASRPDKHGKLNKPNQVLSKGQRKSNGWKVKKISAVLRTMKTTTANRFSKVSIKPNQFKSTPNKFINNISSPSLLITNLHSRVSDSDIRELFSEFGQLKSCSVHFDSTGRSLCTAEVVFVKLSDANRAVQKYNQVPLDGRPMNIQPLITNPLNIAQRIAIISQQAFNKPKGPAFKHANGKQTYTFKRTAGSNRANIHSQPKKKAPQKKTPTVDQLNADLESYIQQKQM